MTILNTNFRTILFCCFFVLSYNNNIQANTLESYPDSSILSLSLAEFEEKMAHYTDLMREESEFTKEEYIEIILIDNTYFLFLGNATPNYRAHAHQDYLDLLQKYMPNILKTLEANEQGCNGGHYSAKYNLCIGGTEPNSNSIYNIK